MNRVLTVIFVLASSALLLGADAADRVREAAAGWTTSAVKQDTAGLNRFLADDLQYAHAGGNTQDKAQYIAAVTNGPARYESFTFEDQKVKLYGNVAVLTGFCDVKMVGRELFRVRTLQVYIERNGQWQMAAHQSTRLAR